MTDLISRKLLAMSVPFLLLFAACGLDEDLYERPDEAREIISGSQLKAFEEAGAKIYGGDSPPDISGTYYFGDYTILYTDSKNFPGPSISYWCHNLITYSQGDPSYQYNHVSHSPNCEISNEGTAGFISGQDNCFTLYNLTERTREGCNITTIGIFSACLEDDGNLREPTWAESATKMNRSQACRSLTDPGLMPARGELFVYTRETERQD